VADSVAGAFASAFARMIGYGQDTFQKIAGTDGITVDLTSPAGLF
jgi:hypothetical protein